MSPQIHTSPQPLDRHPQRPWRPIASAPRRRTRSTVRTFSAPVVRELPPRRDHRIAASSW